jgi:hypothetical protein
MHINTYIKSHTNAAKKISVKSFILIAVAIGSALIISGCMSMPISTMVKMAQFSVHDIEANELRFAVRTDKGVEVKDGAVNMSFSYESDGGGKFEPVSLKHKFLVAAQPDIKMDYEVELSDGMEAHERLTIFKLSDDDAQKLDHLLAVSKKYKAADVKGEGSFSVGFSSHCFMFNDLNDELEVDVFLKTNANDGYMLFMEDVDIFEEAKSRNIDLKEVNKCEAS